MIKKTDMSNHCDGNEISVFYFRRHASGRRCQWKVLSNGDLTNTDAIRIRGAGVKL